MAGKVGRPKKVVPTGSQEITVTLPSDVVALMDAAMAVRGIKYRGAFVRQLIEATDTLLPLLQSSRSEIEEMRDMFRDVKAMVRVNTTQIADLSRALEIDVDDGAFEEIEAIDPPEEIEEPPQPPKKAPTSWKEISRV